MKAPATRSFVQQLVMNQISTLLSICGNQPRTSPRASHGENGFHFIAIQQQSSVTICMCPDERKEKKINLAGGETEIFRVKEWKLRDSSGHEIFGSYFFLFFFLIFFKYRRSNMTFRKNWNQITDRNKTKVHVEIITIYALIGHWLFLYIRRSSSPCTIMTRAGSSVRSRPFMVWARHQRVGCWTV